MKRLKYLLSEVDRYLGISANTLFYTLVTLLALVFITCTIPVFFIDMSRLLHFTDKTGPLGDTIGGTLGPFIGVIASVLTYAAFRVQYKANEQQRKDIALERFESKFFEMLSMHNGNINELEIEEYDFIKTTQRGLGESGNPFYHSSAERTTKKITGRDIFSASFSEFRWCYQICEHILKDAVLEGKERYLVKISYRLFFMGVGSGLVDHVDKRIPEDKTYIKRCEEALVEARKNWIQNLEHITNSPDRIRRSADNTTINYIPFSGYVSKLGRYYRHLYLMVKLVHKQDEKLIEMPEKRDYFRILRAQISDYEQLLLYYNYLSGYGSNWENGSNKFFSDYRMIHNLPFHLATFGITPRVEFAAQIAAISATGEEMFEIDE